MKLSKSIHLKRLLVFFLPLRYLLSTLAFKHSWSLNTLHPLSCWLHRTVYCIFGLSVPLQRQLLSFSTSAGLTSALSVSLSRDSSTFCEHPSGLVLSGAVGRHQRDKGWYTSISVPFVRPSMWALQHSGTCLPPCGVQSPLQSNVGQLMFSIEDLGEGSSTSTINTFIFKLVRGPLNAGWPAFFAEERG